MSAIFLALSADAAKEKSMSRKPQTEAPEAQLTAEEDVLAGYLSQAQFAKQMKRTKRTLARWDVMRIGPPRTMIGNTPYYCIQSAREWLREREQKPQRS